MRNLEERIDEFLNEARGDVPVRVDEVYWSSDQPIPDWLEGSDRQSMLSGNGGTEIRGWDLSDLTIESGRGGREGTLSIRQRVPDDYVSSDYFMEETSDLVRDVRRAIESATGIDVELDLRDATVYLGRPYDERRPLSESRRP